MVFQLLSGIDLIVLAQTAPQRRGQLLGMLFASILIMIIGVVLVIRNRRK